MEVSVCSFESSLSSMKFSRRIHFVRGPLLSRIGAFQSNHAVNPFSQLSASVRDMSRLRFILGFKVFSNRCGLESWENGVEWLYPYRWFVHVGCRHRRLPEIVSDLLLPIAMKTRLVILIASVSAVACDPVCVPSPILGS